MAGARSNGFFMKEYPLRVEGDSGEPAHHNTGSGAGNGSMRGRRLCSRPGGRPGPAYLLLLAVCAILSWLSLGGCGVRPERLFAPGFGDLTVALEGFRSERGSAVVSVFSSPRGFPDDVAAAVATVTATIRDGRAEANFHELPYGEYAVSALHDEDDDGRMATGWLGTPLEGFGFSGVPDVRFGPPAFATVSFPLVGARQELAIALRYETGRRRHQGEERSRGAHRPKE